MTDFSTLSNRAFKLHMRDLDNLRSLYGRMSVDLPRAYIARMKRPNLVDAILAQEFSPDDVIAYKAQCIEWDKMKAFVEGR